MADNLRPLFVGIPPQPSLPPLSEQQLRLRALQLACEEALDRGSVVGPQEVVERAESFLAFLRGGTLAGTLDGKTLKEALSASGGEAMEMELADLCQKLADAQHDAAEAIGRCKHVARALDETADRNAGAMASLIPTSELRTAAAVLRGEQPVPDAQERRP